MLVVIRFVQLLLHSISPPTYTSLSLIHLAKDETKTNKVNDDFDRYLFIQLSITITILSLV